MDYLTIDDVLDVNVRVKEQDGEQSLLLSADQLESAIMRPQMAAHYEHADLVRQAALLVSGIAQAHAFLDGNKRTALLAGEMFLDLNGHMLETAPLEFAEAILTLMNRTDSVEAATHRLEAWMRERLHEKLGRFNVYNGSEWAPMTGLLEYLDPADRAHIESYIIEAGQSSQGRPLSSLLDRLSLAGRQAFLEYRDLAVKGGLPVVIAMYKRETGSTDLNGLVAWLITRRANQ